MHATAIRTRKGIVTIRPLRSGDTSTVEAVFEQLGPHSRYLRFGGTKNLLLPPDLDLLARVDAWHHVLVAYAAGNPIGIAHLARDRDTDSADVASAVADAWQGAGVGTALGRLLAADAAAAGITTLRATIRLENRPALSLMRRLTTVASSLLDAGTVEVTGLIG